MFKRLFCKHDWEVTEKYVKIYSAWVILDKSGTKRFRNCKKCDKHKESWLHYDYKRS